MDTQSEILQFFFPYNPLGEVFLFLYKSAIPWSKVRDHLNLPIEGPPNFGSITNMFTLPDGVQSSILIQVPRARVVHFGNL